MGRVRKGHDIDSALRKKGFIREADGDHLCYFLSGSRIKTKISHGMMGHTIGPELLAIMSRQLHITKTQFIDFIDCTLSEKEFRQLLAMHGF